MKTTKFIILTILLLTPIVTFAKVELFIDAKPSISTNDVKLTTMEDKVKNCEEMGFIHSKNYTGFQTKKGMFKRMKKQAAKVGANMILIKDTKKDALDARSRSNGVVFYCQ